MSMEIEIIVDGAKVTEAFNKNQIVKLDYFKLQEFKRMLIKKDEQEHSVPNDESRLDLITSENKYVSLRVRKLIVLKDIYGVETINYKENFFIFNNILKNKYFVICFEKYSGKERLNDQKNSDSFLDYEILEVTENYGMIKPDQSKNEKIHKFIQYYSNKIDELETEESKPIAVIDVPRLRKYYSIFKTISENENELIIPLLELNKGSRKHKSIVLENKDGKTVFGNPDSIGTIFKAISEKKKIDIKDILFDKDVSEKFNNFGLVESDSISKLTSKILNESVIDLVIKDNLVGEKTRIKRIVKSFIQSIGVNGLKNVGLINILINEDYFSKYISKGKYFNENKEFEEFLDEKTKVNQRINIDQALTLFKLSKLDKIKNDLMLVQGPPGTGKTEIIKEMVNQLYKANKKILITSNVNTALENMKERIKSLKEIIILDIRTLDKEKMQEERKNNIFNYYRNQVYSSFVFDGKIIDKDHLGNIKQKLDVIISNYLKQEKVIESVNLEIDLISDKLKTLENDIKEIAEETDKFNKIISHVPEFKKFTSLDTNEYLSYIYGSNFKKYFTKSQIEEIEKIKENIINTLILERNYEKFIKGKLRYSKFFDFISKNRFYINESLFSDKKIAKKYFDFYDRKKLFIILDTWFNLKYKGTSISSLVETFSSKLDNLKSVDSRVYFKSISNKIMKLNVLKKELDLSLEKGRLLNNQRLINKDKISALNSRRNILIDEIEKSKKKEYFRIEELKRILEVRDLWSKFNLEDVMADYLIYLESRIKKEITLIEKDKESIDFSQVFSSIAVDKLFSLERSSENTDGVVLAMTTNRTALLSKINFTFDYVIVDESSKCSLEDLIVVAPMTSKMILIGDYMQLNPFNLLNHETRKEFSEFMSDEDYLYLKDSKFYDLFDKTYKQSIKENNQYKDSYYISILKKQYRMSTDIYSLVSKVYNIHDGLSIETEIDDDQKSLIFIDVEGAEANVDDDTSYYNQEEVEFSGQIMDIINNIGIGPKKVAFITGYQEQVTRINRNKNKKKLDYSVQVGTIDTFQGKEFDIVVLSLVRTERLGFMSEVRRLNVALSRGKKKLVVLGNKQKLSKVISEELNKISYEKDILRKKEKLALINNIIPHLLSYSTDFSGKENNVKKLKDFFGDINE